MKKFHSCVVNLFLMLLMMILLGGCGGNSGGETTPAPAQTGDTTLFPNARLLASPQDVDISQAIVLDARTLSDYETGHIPGAISAPPSRFENNGVLKDDTGLENELSSLGVSRTSKIIIYDNTTTSLGAAGRLFWILEYLGCTDVKILNGGWYQWKAQDMNSATERTTLPPAMFKAEINPTVQIATKEYVADHFLPAPDNGFSLLDVRSPEEYQGSTLNGAPRPGHIPGAINFPYNECFNTDKTILNYQDLSVLLKFYQISVNNEMVVYSGLGHRSGFFYFLCRLMGYSNVVIYTGSVIDWGNADPNTYPMKIGTSP